MFWVTKDWGHRTQEKLASCWLRSFSNKSISFLCHLLLWVTRRQANLNCLLQSLQWALAGVVVVPFFGWIGWMLWTLFIWISKVFVRLNSSLHSVHCFGFILSSMLCFLRVWKARVFLVTKASSQTSQVNLFSIVGASGPKSSISLLCHFCLWRTRMQAYWNLCLQSLQYVFFSSPVCTVLLW